jgi:hypothetical protein
MLLSVLKVLEFLSPLEAQKAGILTEVPVDFLGPSRQMVGSYLKLCHDHFLP